MCISSFNSNRKFAMKIIKNGLNVESVRNQFVSHWHHPPPKLYVLYKGLNVDNYGWPLTLNVDHKLPLSVRSKITWGDIWILIHSIHNKFISKKIVNYNFGSKLPSNQLKFQTQFMVITHIEMKALGCGLPC